MKAFTDISQSKKLKEYLPLESADMYYDIDSYGVRTTPEVLITSIVRKKDIPCWSLAALLEIIKSIQMIPYKDGFVFPYIEIFPRYSIEFSNANNVIAYYNDSDNLVDTCVEMIEKLHEQNLI